MEFAASQTMTAAYDPAQFSLFERAGWQRVGSAYKDSFGLVTHQSVNPLLEAVQARAGQRLLDVCCGPGFVTVEAARRGSLATGIDVTPAMYAQTQAAHPHIEFRHGDAQALPFADSTFDAVVCSFGILHLPDPDRGVAEAFRVLKPGGWYALTDWPPPAPGTFRGLLPAAIQRHGTLDVPVPQGPPPARFAHPETSAQALHAAGFVGAEFRHLQLELAGVPAHGVLDALIHGTVRNAALFSAQTPQAQRAIREMVTELARPFEQDGTVRIPCPAALAWARKP
jgi:ubiquinone/menaquinone biosynthesis C-methylase UbiE